MVQYGAAGTGLANGRSDVAAAPNVIHQTARCSFGATKPRHPAQPRSSINLRQWHSPDYENNGFGKRKTLIGHPCGKDWCRESGTNTDGCAGCRSFCPPPPLLLLFLLLLCEDPSVPRRRCTQEAEGCVRRKPVLVTLWSRSLHPRAALTGRPDWAPHVVGQPSNLMHFTEIGYVNVLSVV